VTPARLSLRFLALAPATAALAACDAQTQGAQCTPDGVLVTVTFDATATTDPPDSMAPGDTTAPTDAATAPEVVDDARADGGDTSVLPVCPWQPWDDGLQGGRVDLVAFDPRVAGTAWATSGGALVRSLDGGVTWDPASDDLGPTQLAFPADDPKALLAGGSGVWASNDIGRSFEPQALGGLHVSALLVHPAAPQRVFVGTHGGGILRSNDGGKGFTPVNVGVPRLFVWAMSAPTDDPDVVLATGVAQNDSYGVGAGGYILRSADGGATWTTVSTDLVWGYDIAVCPSDARRVLAAARRGVLESRDGGLTWQRVGLFGARDALSIDWVAERCDAWWVSVYQQGIFRVDDDGLTLTGPMKDGLDVELDRFAGQLAAHPTDPGVVLVATHAGLYRSANGGYRWAPVDAAKGLSMVDLDAADDRAWLATWGNRLWTRTPDSPWQKVTSVPRDLILSVSPDPADPARAVVGSASDVWLTTRGPEGFGRVPGVINAFDALTLDEPREHLIASQVLGVVRASDPEAAWTPSNEGLEPFPTSAGTFIDTRMLAADPDVAGRVYVALNGRGVAVSEDRGWTWARPDNALADKAVTRLYAAPVKGAARLFALVVGGGVWISDDGALTWTTDNEGLSSLGLNDLAVDVTTGRAYVSEGGGGPIFGSEDGLSWRPLDRWCLPDGGWGPLAIVRDGVARWLVAGTLANRVIRHKL